LGSGDVVGGEQALGIQPIERGRYDDGCGGSISMKTYWDAIEPIWNDVDIDTPESFLSSFPTVPPELGLLYAAYFGQSEVCNGGFVQFFRNSTGVLAPEAVKGLEAIGQPQLANVLSQAMALLGSPYLRQRKARQEAAEKLRIQGKFAPLEEEFYKLISIENGGFESAANAYAASIVR
jgi:hypothetical protein